MAIGSEYEEGFYVAKLDAKRSLLTYNDQGGLPVRFDTRQEAEAWALDMKLGVVILQIRIVSLVVPEMKIVAP